MAQAFIHPQANWGSSETSRLLLQLMPYFGPAQSFPRCLRIWAVGVVPYETIYRG
jgi:hypothetical protein